MRCVADWFEAGAANDDKLYYVDVARWGVEALTAGLTGRGFDVDRALRRGRLEFVTLDDVLHVGARGGLVDRALYEEERAGVRLAVRSDALAGTVAEDVYLGVEKELARLCHEEHVSVLCQYDGRTTQGASLTAALDLHPDWVYEADLNVRRRGCVVQVEGMLDTLDGEVLRRSLTRMTRDLAPGTLLALDLRSVDALTAGACQALIDGTRAFRDAGGLVRCGVPTSDAGRLLLSKVADEANFQVG
jgi:hypothetical protein